MHPTALLISAILLLNAGGASAQARNPDDECVRSEPSPVISDSHAGIAAHTFELVSSHEAVERFQLESGGQVEIHHGGCEYFTTTFRFESKSLFARGHTYKASFAAGAHLLRTLRKLGVDAVFDLEGAAATLESAPVKHPHLQFEQDLAVEGDRSELAAHVQLDGAGRQGKVGFVQVTLFMGPL